MAIKFNTHHVTDGSSKARVWYSLDNHVSGLPTVTIYAKDFESGRALGSMIGGDAYRNDTDLQTDYFDEGRVILQEGHPLYVAARVGAVAAEAKKAAGRAARRERALNPQPADPSTVEIRGAKATEYARYFDVVSGGQAVLVITELPGKPELCRVQVQNAMARAYRGSGKSFRSLAEARKNYRCPKVLAALDAVEAAKVSA